MITWYGRLVAATPTPLPFSDETMLPGISLTPQVAPVRFGKAAVTARVVTADFLNAVPNREHGAIHAPGDGLWWPRT